ncbi:hypothetical protein BGZ93_010957 [Podila epicladia]|nr:hypothetical protein BGZ92_008885 [Podila epicladia]KAG0087439.1 hypothetical protein BGZ93_010957 [Podila epicladia]
MSGFFGSAGSNTNSSSGSGAGAGSGGGGWGSFLKQGLSSIESKIDMVLDINVPIGGTSGTLTSFSPHATVLPSSVTGVAVTNTPPQKQPRPQIPSGNQSDATEQGATNEDISRPSSRTSVRKKGSAQDLKKSGTAGGKREGSTEADEVTIDPITGMITTTPGVKRMSTPPVNASQGSNSATSAAAAAAAANRERLEQRMRGIFKKTTDSPPATPSRTPNRTPVPMAAVAPSPRPSLQEEPVDEVPQVDQDKDTESVQKGETNETKYEKLSDEAVKSEPRVSISKDDENVAEETLSIDKEVDKQEAKQDGDVKAEATNAATTEPSTTKLDEKLVSIDEVPPMQETNGDSIGGVGADEPTTDESSEVKDDDAVKPIDASSTSTDLKAETPTTEGDLQPYTPDSEVAVSNTGDDAPTVDIATYIQPVVSEPAKDPETSVPTAKTTSNKLSSSDAQLQKVVEQREEQLFKVMQEHSQLLEKFRDLEDAKAAQDSVQNTKMAGLEKIIENQKKELELVRVNSLASQPKSIQKTLEEQRGLLEEKDEQIRGLLAEGEVLSKKEFKSLTIIKTLRAKTIETEKAQLDLQRKLDKAMADHSEALSKLAKVTDDSKQLNDTVKALNDSNQRQNKHMSKIETELVQLREDKANLQMNLDRSWQELSEARKASAELSSQTHAAALDREVKLNEELNDQLDALKSQHATIESNLRQEIQDLRVSLSNREELAGEKEDQLWTEIRGLQARLEQNDNDSYEFQEALDEARRPLLRQIEVLQNQQGVAQRNWDKIEKSLTRRVTEAEEDVAKAQEREKLARDKLDETKSQISGLEARIETLRLADTQLRSDINVARRTCLEKEEAARHAQADLNRERVNRERAIEEAKEDAERKWRQQQQTEVDKLKQQIQQLQQRASETTLQPVPASARRASSSSGMSSPLLSGASKVVQDGNNNIDLDSLASPSSVDGMPSLSRTSSSHAMSGASGSVGLLGLSPSSGTGPAVAIERLNTMVRQLEGQVTFLTEQVRTTNKNKDELSDELVKVTMELEELQSLAAKVPGLEQELHLLQERHKAALEMLGERTEEVQELRADIVDVKEAYRDQISELLSQLEKAKR